MHTPFYIKLGFIIGLPMSLGADLVGPKSENVENVFVSSDGAGETRRDGNAHFVG